ncbi:MAG: hypothetical protein SGJ21_03060 [Alphaproteobacteria bacterium]|nr:hypothetical protein [Alphaproteobacteria bacterium]
MTKTIVRLFDRPADAMRASEEIERMGIPHSDISLVANNREGWYDKKDGLRHDRLDYNRDGKMGDGMMRNGKKDADRDGEDDRVEGAEKGAAYGGLVGGGAGLLAGLGMLAIPGIGPIVAAGWLASTAVGAAAGAVAGGATGGILGALTKEGVPERDAHVYAEGVRRGGSLLTVRAPDDRINEVEMALKRFNSTDASTRSTAYTNDGWSKFDSMGSEYDEDQIAKERMRYPTTPIM